MRVMRSNAHLFGLLAAWVLALAMMAPTVSHWVQARGGTGGDWVEVCTAQGPQRVQLGSDPSSPAAPMSFMVDCGFCILQAHQAAMVVAPLLLALWFADPEHVAPRHEPGPAFTEAVWQPQQSRAPPFLA